MHEASARLGRYDHQIFEGTHRIGFDSTTVRIPRSRRHPAHRLRGFVVILRGISTMSKTGQHMVAALMTLACLSGCATVTPVSGKFPDISPMAAQTGHYQGQEVRWGGTLIDTHPETQQTCFTVLGEPLSSDGRPRSARGKAHIGRFIACAPGFYDPMLYRAGREITFIGRVERVVHHQVGQFDYAYPELAASTVYLWPIEPPRPRVDEQVFMGSGFGFGYYPGWWFGPGWGYWPGWRY
ncbi:Slp family lipoprotein [Acidithiobacillus ferrianus]